MNVASSTTTERRAAARRLVRGVRRHAESRVFNDHVATPLQW